MNERNREESPLYPDYEVIQSRIHRARQDRAVDLGNGIADGLVALRRAAYAAVESVLASREFKRRATSGSHR
jgi:hypothetical protein